jgi:hypothetical protein
MKRLTGLLVIAVLMLTATMTWAASCFDVMEQIQEKITWQVWNANGWAASPVVVEAVLAQNARGPIPGMDNAKWKTVPEGDAIVQGFINNEAAKFLKAEMAKTEGISVIPTRDLQSLMCPLPAVRPGRESRNWMTAAKYMRSRFPFLSSLTGN